VEERGLGKKGRDPWEVHLEKGAQRKDWESAGELSKNSNQRTYGGKKIKGEKKN